MDRPLGWDKELEELCNTALRYFPDGWAQRTVARFRQYTPEEFDKSELRMMRYDVIRTAQEYRMYESSSEMLRVKYYDTSDAIFKKPLRYVADIACNIVDKVLLQKSFGVDSPLQGSYHRHPRRSTLGLHPNG